MNSAPHPDQSWEAIQNARANSTKNPAPPTRGTPIVATDTPPEPSAPKPGQPGWEYKPMKPLLTPEQLMEALDALGFRDMQAAVEGLRLQNAALLGENARLTSENAALRARADAMRPSERTSEGVTDAEFEDIAEAHATDAAPAPESSRTQETYYKGD